MQSEFGKSLLGELTYFLGLQVNKMEDNLFISQRKYANSIVKKFGLEKESHKKTRDATLVKLTKDDSGVDVEQSLY